MCFGPDRPLQKIVYLTVFLFQIWFIIRQLFFLEVLAGYLTARLKVSQQSKKTKDHY